MAYGIKVLGPSGAYTVLNTDIAMEGTVAITYGSGSSIAYDRAHILAVRKTVSSGTTFWLCATHTVSGSTITTSFRNEFGTSTTANYVVLKPTNSITPSGSYGHVTYATNGTTRTFDSRLFGDIGSFNITNVAPGGSYPDGSTLTTYNTYEYFNASWIYWLSATQIYFASGLRFSNGHSVHGTTVKYEGQKTIAGVTTYPDLESGLFWGNFV